MKRRWFQIHLSTAIVLMFVAGGLVWLNVRQHTVNFSVIEYGWPMAAYGDSATEVIHKAILFFSSDPETVAGNLPPEEGGWGGVLARIRWRGVATNAVVTLVILLTTVRLSEHLIRRGESLN